MDEKELGDWVRAQFQRANKFLAENGILFKSVVTEESRYLAPHVALWKIISQDNKRYWVISGDVPADVTAEGSAKSAREAIRYFSLQWQIKAENLQKLAQTDKTQAEYSTYLQTKAEMLYDVSSQENLWQEV